MAKAPTTDLARARAAYVLGRINHLQYAECIWGQARVSGSYLIRESLNRRGWPCRELHRLPEIGTYRKEAKHG